MVFLLLKKNMVYLRKFPNVEILAMETRSTSPLALSGHVTVQIIPLNSLVTVLIRAIHPFELTCRLVALFCNQSIRTCYNNKT